MKHGPNASQGEVLLQRIEQQRATLIADVAALTPEAQRWREQPARWCALDIVEHLVLAEQVVLGDLHTAMVRSERVPTFGQRMRAVIVWLVLRTGVRVRVPSPSMLPSGSPSLTELCARWDGQHAALRQFVGALDEQALHRRWFRHPIAGPLHTIEALTMLSAHLATHQRQLTRLCKALAAASGTSARA